MYIFFDTYDSPLGEMLIECNLDRLLMLRFLDTLKKEELSRFRQYGVSETFITKKIKDWLDRYFNGEKPDSDEIPIELIVNTNEVTDFRKKIYEIAMEIPYGTTISYADLDEKYRQRYKKDRIGPRAVGDAMGHNPILIFIPCHRVLRKDGSIGGFQAGIDRKIKLLELEGINGNKET